MSAVNTNFLMQKRGGGNTELLVATASQSAQIVDAIGALATKSDDLTSQSAQIVVAINDMASEAKQLSSEVKQSFAELIAVMTNLASSIQATLKRD
jgi:methyl-accepting chemotaxis protein